MSVAETSKAAYHAIEHKLTGRRLEVYNAIAEMGVASNYAISKHLGWEINRVTGRSNELAEMGKIEVSRVSKGQFGHNVKVWQIKAEKQINIMDVLERDCEV